MIVITYVDAHRERKRDIIRQFNRCNLFVLIRSQAQTDYFHDMTYVELL